jgi:hypothetical protein
MAPRQRHHERIQLSLQNALDASLDLAGFAVERLMPWAIELESVLGADYSLWPLVEHLNRWLYNHNRLRQFALFDIVVTLQEARKQACQVKRQVAKHPDQHQKQGVTTLCSELVDRIDAQRTQLEEISTSCSAYYGSRSWPTVQQRVRSGNGVGDQSSFSLERG